MAFCNRLSSVLKQSISQSSASSYNMMNSIRCMSTAQSKLFIGGLSFNTDDNSLKDAFSCFGEVVEARVIMDRETGRSRGFGFVNFSDTESASQAIADMDGQDLHGRIIRVNYARERQPRTGGFYGSGWAHCVGGPIYSGTGSGFGVVEFFDTESASEAIAGMREAISAHDDAHDTDLQGRTIRVDYAQERQPRTGEYGSDGRFNGSGWGYCVGGPIYSGIGSGFGRLNFSDTESASQAIADMSQAIADMVGTRAVVN